MVVRIKKVRLTYGIHDFHAEVAGLSVTEAKLAYQDILNVGTDAEVYVNGVLTPDDTILCAGSRVEFMKVMGRKGGNYTSVEHLKMLTGITEARFTALQQDGLPLSTIEAVHDDHLSEWIQRIVEVADSAPEAKLEIDKERHTIRWRGTTLHLPGRKLFGMCECLVRKIGAYVEVSDLMSEVWSDDKFVEKNAVQKVASRLQRLLHETGMTDLWIDGKSCPGFYRLQIFPEKPEKSATGQQHDNAVSAD